MRCAAGTKVTSFTGNRRQAGCIVVRFRLLLQWLAAAGLLTKQQAGKVVRFKAGPGLAKLWEFRET
jgi:hypothetical protein